MLRTLFFLSIALTKKTSQLGWFSFLVAWAWFSATRSWADETLAKRVDPDLWEPIPFKLSLKYTLEENRDDGSLCYPIAFIAYFARVNWLKVALVGWVAWWAVTWSGVAPSHWHPSLYLPLELIEGFNIATLGLISLSTLVLFIRKGDDPSLLHGVWVVATFIAVLPLILAWLAIEAIFGGVAKGLVSMAKSEEDAWLRKQAAKDADTSGAVTLAFDRDENEGEVSLVPENEEVVV